MKVRLPSVFLRIAQVAGLAAVAAACVGAPPEDALDARLDFPGVRMVADHWRQLLVDPDRRVYAAKERGGVAFDPREGLVFAGTSQGRFLALASGTGRLVWAHDEIDGFGSMPLVLDDLRLVVAGNDDGRLLAFEPAGGSVVWSAELGGPVRGRPEYRDGVLYLRTVNQKVFALEAASGRELWTYERPLPEGYFSGSEPGMLVTAERVVTGFTDGTVTAFSPVTGETLWTVNLSTGGHDELVLDDVCATPVAAGDVVVVSSYDNGLFGLDAAEGAQRWARSDLTHVTGLAIHEETDVLAAVAGKGLARLDGLDGATVWMRRFPAGTLSDPVLRDGVVVVSDDMHGLLFFEALTGILLQDLWLGTGVAAPPALAGDRLAVLDNTGELLSFWFLRRGFPTSN